MKKVISAILGGVMAVSSLGIAASAAELSTEATAVSYEQPFDAGSFGSEV